MIFGKRNFKVVRVTIDVALIFLSFFAAVVLAQPLHILQERLYMFLLPLLLSGLWYFTANLTNFYEDFSSRYFPNQVVYILKNIVIQIAFSIVFIFLIKEELYTRNFVVFFTILITFTVSINFIILRSFIRKQKRDGLNFRNLLIIGAGNVGIEFRNVIEKDISLGYIFTGFLDDDPQLQDVPGILGKIENLEAVAKSKMVDGVVIALPGGHAEVIHKIMRICNKLAIRTYIIPDYFKFLSRKFQVDLIGNFPIITVRSEPLEEIHWQFIKRLFDITISLFSLLLIASWFFPIIIILQKILSPGPVFYIQNRIGKNNTIFRCFKFRSMVHVTTEREFSATKENDPRITSFGRILRKGNIDELPQLFNVLFGDMSIVGPRPHAVNYNMKYEGFVEALRLRNLVKPGITGWAQVHGLRGDVADETENRLRIMKRFEYDVWYVENWTFGLDIQIIFFTFWEMIKGRAKGV